MLQLDSNNYTKVAVTFRDDPQTKFMMPRSTGDKLMDYLSGGSASRHVILTDVNGIKKTVHTSEIVSAQPVYALGVDKKNYANLEALKAEVKPSDTSSHTVSEEERQHKLEMIAKMRQDFLKKLKERKGE